MRCWALALLAWLSACQGEPVAVRVLLGERFVCTGALVGGRAVLTARHCVPADDAGISVRFPSGETVPVATVERASGADPAGDLAVLRLSRSPRAREAPLGPGKTPVRVGASAWLLRAGRPAVAARVTATDPGVLYTTPASCDGDSGAPLLVDGVVVAVASSRAFGSCGEGPSVFAELGPQGAWLAQVLGSP